MARTCSLKCSKSHKSRSGCTGKRCRERFIAVDEYDEKTMMSDYWLLEDITGVAEGAERRRMAETSKTWRGKTNQRLISAASRAGVSLILMSEGRIPGLLFASEYCCARSVPQSLALPPLVSVASQ
jgi:hypothetical protein